MRTSCDNDALYHQDNLGQVSVLIYSSQGSEWHKYRFWVVLVLSVGLHLLLWVYRSSFDFANQTEATPIKTMDISLVSPVPASPSPSPPAPNVTPPPPKSKPLPAKPKPQMVKPTPVREPKPQEELSKNDAVTPLKALSESGPSVDSAKPSVPSGMTQRAEWKSAGLQNSPAKYPERARQMDWQGRVVLRVQVLPDGAAGIVAVAESSGHEVLDESALEAVRHWKFIAAKRDGIAVESFVNVPINFKLKKEGD